ncbi:MAG: SCP2 sterol-binding domain-containing protein [Candidatus Brockarchaeota archaeon]|nr:SCP2 sterol-binding domain-containing protein [Candidatus Brockarchaeota archaeon]
MPTKEQVFESLDEIRKRFEDPSVKEKFKGFKREIWFKFPDLNVEYVLSINEDAVATLREGVVEKPDVTVEMDSTTFLGIRNKRISATQAYMSGKLKVKGAMPDLLKLQRLL